MFAIVSKPIDPKTAGETTGFFLFSKTKTKMTKKGLEEELRQFAKAIKGETQWPNPLWQQMQTMEISFFII